MPRVCSVLRDALRSLVCDDQARYPGGCTPHLTVGRIVGEDVRGQFLRELVGSWEPLRWTVDRVTVLQKPRGERFEALQELLPGGAPG